MFLLHISLSIRRIPTPKILLQMVFPIANLQCRIQHNGHLESVLALTICRAILFDSDEKFMRKFIDKFSLISGCVGTVCPCFLFGKNAEFLGSGTLAGSCMTHFILWGLVNSLCCLFTGGLLAGVPGSMVACYACGYRKTLRAKYNLQEAPCGDLPTHLFCHLCALCQEYREIRERSNGSCPTLALSPVAAPPTQTMENDGR
ncbi:hypothetical protein ZIOFF_012652 [Zingiber officinale]|uniref:Uncharacterized protein n=1 Tax=Zingiber officinale TaxID=94328 RepID=A0A8J5LQW3_ZINOF|nr:hypothetical protein ZIOFF_012652 [Zingiber officinale]